ncbi:MAG: class I SAM-dependent methyltransferase [Thermomicrobiales bacterium]
MDPYESIAALYDLEHDEFSDDLDWYAQLVSLAGPRVLELGCGSGRVLAPLIEAGATVTGVDLSAAMLDRARLRLAAPIRAGRARLIEGAMTDLTDLTPGPFDLAIVSLNGLLHVETAAEQREVLQQVHDVLRPGGLLAVDVLHAVPDALDAFDGRVMHEWSVERDDRSSVAKFSARGVDWTSQVIETDLWYDQTGVDGSLRRERSAFTMRWLTASETELMLELAGFADWDLAGSYDGSPLSDLSDRLLVVARKGDRH